MPYISSNGRYEIDDNVDKLPGNGDTVGELREFLSTLPDDMLIVWGPVVREKPLLMMAESRFNTLYICEHS